MKIASWPSFGLILSSTAGVYGAWETIQKTGCIRPHAECTEDFGFCQFVIDACEKGWVPDSTGQRCTEGERRKATCQLWYECAPAPCNDAMNPNRFYTPWGCRNSVGQCCACNENRLSPRVEVDEWFWFYRNCSSEGCAVQPI